jgi:hypothetical protein
VRGKPDVTSSTRRRRKKEMKQFFFYLIFAHYPRCHLPIRGNGEEVQFLGKILFLKHYREIINMITIKKIYDSDNHNNEKYQ